MGVGTLVVRAWRLTIRGTILAGFAILVLPVAALSMAVLPIATLPVLLLGRGLRAVGRGKPGRFKTRRRGAISAFGFMPLGRLVSQGFPLEVLVPSLPLKRPPEAVSALQA